MALTAGNVTSLKSHHQRAKCRFVAFPAFTDTDDTPISSGAYSFSDMVNMFPRYSWVDNGASITIDGADSIQRSGAAATGHTWTLTNSAGGAAAGSKVDNGDETVYTAPGSGSGIDRLELDTAGSTGEHYAYIAYGDVNMNIGEITSYHADTELAGWEMTVRAYGDCSALARQVGVLLVLDTYWNGSKSNFGGYKWSEGVFYGYIDRLRMVHEDANHTYLEVRLIPPSTLLNYVEMDEVFWATSGSDEEITVADLKVLDIVWAQLQQCSIDKRHNIVMYADNNGITNLKLSRGPIWDVMTDVAGRTFNVIYANRTGDIYVLPHKDVRWWDYQQSPSSEFTLNVQLFESIDLYSQDVDVGDPPVPADQSIKQVIFSAILPDLSEIWARWPADAGAPPGHTVEVSGLICETPYDLEVWAYRYFYSIQPEVEADISGFMLHTLDIYQFVDLTFTPASGRVTDTGINVPSGDRCWVTSIDYGVDPGMGTWRSRFHVKEWVANDDSDPEGENSSD